ncbi:DUF688 domain-containing protein, partial [Cephalotus follicularis]
MEDKKINFNAPLLSVRRFSTSLEPADRENVKTVANTLPDRRHTLPFHRQEFALDQVTEPVAVPFLWEQVPGRAKDGIGPEPQPEEEASCTPRLPPARIVDVTKHPLQNKSGEKNDVRIHTEVHSPNDNVGKLDCSKEAINESVGTDSGHDEDGYSNAMDTLSLTDSFSLNCSVSGLSGSDCLVAKPSGTFSTDLQTQDFMMRRFLPAAKAMALEPIQYASRKQLVSIEPSIHIKNVSGDRRPAGNRYKSIVIQQYGQDQEQDESEDEHEYDNLGNASSKACGLFPQLRVRNFCLLNPLPTMKLKTQSSVSSPFEAGRLAKAASIGSHNQIVNKDAWDAIGKHNLKFGARSCELTKIDNKPNSGSNRFSYSSDLQTINRTSPYRRSRSSCVSPYRNAAPQSPFHGSRFLGIPKEACSLRASRLNLNDRGTSKYEELYFPRSTKLEFSSKSPVVEKTLYVDTVHISEISFSNSKNVESFTLNQGLDQESRALVCIKVDTDENLDSSNHQLLKTDDRENVEAGLAKSPLPPPLPKTPSESWLWRTLPSVSSQNPLSQSYYGSRFKCKKQDSKTYPADSKWETIVKTSFLHHDHVRYSE